MLPDQNGMQKYQCECANDKTFVRELLVFEDYYYNNNYIIQGQRTFFNHNRSLFISIVNITIA